MASVERRQMTDKHIWRDNPPGLSIGRRMIVGGGFLAHIEKDNSSC
jgi:hypothetical protein